MNEDIKRFLEKNNIDIEEVGRTIDCNLMLPQYINPIASDPRYACFKTAEDKFISIADIVGYNYEGRVTNPNIFHSMEAFFDSKEKNSYKSRSIGLLDYSFENILEGIKKSFETEPIEVEDMGNNNYVISRNGLHRYTVLRALYLSEYQKCNGDKREVEKLKQKYTILVKARELDETKTYCIFLLNKLGNNIQYKTDNIILEKKDGSSIKLPNDKFIDFCQQELKKINWQSIYGKIAEYQVLKNFISQSELSSIGYNNELMSIAEYENLTNQYAAINQNARSIPKTARATYNYVKKEESKFIQLAQYLGLGYELGGMDRTHISTIISQLENNSENMQRDMYKVTDEDKIYEIRSKVEDVKDSVFQACEITQNAYIKEMKSEFIGSYEAKIQQLITDSKIAKFKEEKFAVANQRVSIIGKLFGKEKLKEAQLVNFNKKMEIQRLRTYERGFRDFSVNGEKGIMTPEIEEFIKLLESEPKFENVAKEVKAIFESVIEQENKNSKMIPQNSKVSIRKQLKSIEQENEALSGEIGDIKAQDAESKRGNVFSKIDNTKSNALIQFETILQNAERALHIEYEKENDRVKQETLDR